MRRCCLFFLMFFAACLFVQAQNSVSGKVLDETQNGVPYGTVRLLGVDSVFICGTATDSLGHYILKDITTGNYLVSISSIGYDSQVFPIYVEATDQVVTSVFLKSSNILFHVVIRCFPVFVD